MCEEFGAGFGGQPSHELSDAAAKRIPETESSAETSHFRAHWESRFNPNGNRSSRALLARHCLLGLRRGFVARQDGDDLANWRVTAGERLVCHRAAGVRVSAH